MEEIEKRCKMFFDGACKGNPGPAGVGFNLIFPDGRKMGMCKFIGENSTNNSAEWEALLFGLKYAVNQGIKNIDIYGDSELVIKQLTGEYKVKNENIKSKYELAKITLKLFDSYTLNHILRDKNSLADLLANKAIKLKTEPIEQELTPFHILNIKNNISGSWTEFLDNNFIMKTDKNGLPRYFIKSDVLYIGEVSDVDVILWNEFMEKADKAMSSLIQKDSNGNLVAVPLHEKRYKLFQMCMFDLDNFRRFIFESKFLECLPVRPHILENIKTSNYQLIHFGILYLRMVFLIEDTRHTILAE